MRKSTKATIDDGCIRTRDDKYHFSAGLDAMMETLEPKNVLIYGNMSENIFGRYKNFVIFHQFQDWISRVHAR